MATKYGFCDLNISDQQSEKDLALTCEMLVKLGYQTIAINHSMSETEFQNSGNKKKKGPMDVVPAPINIDNLKQRFEKKLNILQRLTVAISDKDQAHKLSTSEHLKKYNLLAILPTNEATFQHACSTMKIDIISFSPGLGGEKDTSSLKINRKMYSLAVDRGIYFELMYAPAITDSTARKNTIHMSHAYHSFGKSKNIIITSAAGIAFHIRGPYDIINLGLLFGLSEEQSKSAIMSTCRSLVISAEGRRHGKAMILVTPLVDLQKPNEVLNTRSKDIETGTHIVKKPRLK